MSEHGMQGRWRVGRIAGLGLLLASVAITGCKYVPAPQVTPGPVAQSERASQANTMPGQSAADGGGSYGQEREGRRRSRHGGRGHAEAEAAPGQFDFYLLNLSWSPEYCATHADSPECGKGLGFVVHGLWPQDTTGSYPEDCSDAAGPTNPGADTDIFPTASLVEHEWKTHGTCSGLGADVYFATVHKAFAEVRIPAGIGARGGAASEAPAMILQAFQGANPGFPAGSFALSCGNNRLTAVEVCLDKGLRPEACQGVRGCGAQVVKVTPE